MIVNKININPVVNEEGEESSPYTLTITNICDGTKELQLRLNILEETTFKTKALTISSAGHIELKPTLYSNLSNSKTTNENAIQSKLIGKISIEPNETIRTNIKLWFDERKTSEIKKEDIFKAQFELIDTESTIKSPFYEVILSNESDIDKKNLLKAGRAIVKFMNDAKRDIPDAEYLLIIEGQTSRDNYPRNYQLSYERALSLVRYWVSNGIKFDKLPCEVIISGSGYASPFRISPDISSNTLNQRFVIHIVPKPGIM